MSLNIKKALPRGLDDASPIVSMDSEPCKTISVARYSVYEECRLKSSTYSTQQQEYTHTRYKHAISSAFAMLPEM